MRRSNYTDKSRAQNLRRDGNYDRKELLTMLPPVTAPPGLRTIKMVKLSKKYAPLVPQEYRTRAIYQKPDAAELEKFECEKQAKATSK